MKQPIIAVVLIACIAVPTYAAGPTLPVYQHEVVCGTSWTRMDSTPLMGRKSIGIRNKDSAAIGVFWGDPALASTTQAKAETVGPGELYGLNLPNNVPVYCISVAGQTTGSATIFSESQL